MMQSILVALDGSPEGEAILKELNRFISSSSILHLLHVLPEPTPPVGGVLLGLLKIADEAEDYLSKAASRIHEGKVTTVVRTGHAVHEIVKASNEFKSQVVAMTTHARSGLRRMLMGSIAEGVVRESDIPVLLVRPGVPVREGPPRRILVAVDGSPASFSIMESIRMLEGKENLEVILYQAVPIVVVGDPVTGLVLPTIPMHLPDPKPNLEAHAKLLTNEGFKVRIVSSLGDPVMHILDQAKESDVDVIAMSTAGRSGVTRWVMGSVAESVLRHMDRPLLLHKMSSVKWPS